MLYVGDDCNVGLAAVAPVRELTYLVKIPAISWLPARSGCTPVSKIAIRVGPTGAENRICGYVYIPIAATDCLLSDHIVQGKPCCIRDSNT